MPRGKKAETTPPKEGPKDAAKEKAKGRSRPEVTLPPGAPDLLVERLRDAGFEVRREEAAPSEGLLRAETLKGDIRDRLLAIVKAMPKPFEGLDEKGQTLLAEAVGLIAERLIFGAIEIVHAEGAPSLRMTVDGVSFKKGVRVTLQGSRRDPYRHLLADATDADVLVVIEGAARFMGEAAPPAIDKDAPELDLHPQAEG